jgi:hypothetical protein
MDFDRLGRLQAAKVLRQQGGTHTAESISAVTFGAEPLVVIRCIGQCRRHAEHQPRSEVAQDTDPAHRATEPVRLLQGVTSMRGGMSRTPISMSSR